MSIFYSRIKTIGVKQGSIVKAAAYRSGEKLTRDKTGEIADYSRKQGVLHSEIIAPDNAPAWAKKRASLWNKVEKKEDRSNSRFAKEIVLALPYELDTESNIAVLQHYVKSNFTKLGMVADIAIHTPDPSRDAKGEYVIDQRNVHAHILLTDRPIKNGEFTPKKNRSWNKVELVEKWRKDWASTLNTVFQIEGVDEQLDHRSYKRQGIDVIPQIKEGKLATALRRKGELTDRAEYNEQVKEANILIKDIKEQIRKEKETEIKRTRKPDKPDRDTTKQAELLESLKRSSHGKGEPEGDAVEMNASPWQIRTLSRAYLRLGMSKSEVSTRLNKLVPNTPQNQQFIERIIERNERLIKQRRRAVLKPKSNKTFREEEALKISQRVARQKRNIEQVNNPVTAYRLKLAELTKNSNPDSVAKSYQNLDNNALECDRRIRDFMRRRGFSDVEIKKAMRRASPALYRKSKSHADLYAKRFNEWARKQQQQEKKNRQEKQRTRRRI